MPLESGKTMLDGNVISLGKMDFPLLSHKICNTRNDIEGKENSVYLHDAHTAVTEVPWDFCVKLTSHLRLGLNIVYFHRKWIRQG